ncbi:hypothetical protein PVAG01_10354 [Phlyctema vagabunda]|uniref:Uncharacterized protein n=1 Tax=Phlyctema vagabunda TaxID=108571 RepID=A0ABR4P5R4_9HELO
MPSVAEIPTRKRRREDEDVVASKKLSSPRHSTISLCQEQDPEATHPLSRYYTQPRKMHELKRQRIEATPSTVLLHPTTQIQQQAVREEKKERILSPCHICHRKPSVRSDLDSYADCQGCAQRTCYVCIRECLGVSDDPDLDLDPRARLREGGGMDLERPWDCKGMVCSRCCVERGTEGEVLCLGCLRREGGG